MPGDGPAAILSFIRDQLFGRLPVPTTSFAGQTVIITGSNTGLGFEAAKHIVRLGAAKLIIAFRTIKKGEAAKLAIEQDFKNTTTVIEVWPLDLESYTSVRAFCARATAELDRLDVLLQNAAVGSYSWATVEGNERMLTVNVISTFLLASSLLPKLRESAINYKAQGHLAFVTSDTHYLVDFNERKAPEGKILEYMNDQSQADIQGRYPTTKLIGIFLVREMVRRLGKDFPVTITLVNPGLCSTSLDRDIDAGVALTVMKAVLARTAEQGSRTLVHGASVGTEAHGEYLNRCRVCKPAKVLFADHSQETQSRVWNEVTAKLEKIAPGVLTQAGLN